MTQNTKKMKKKIRIKPIPAAITAGTVLLVLVIALAAAFSGAKEENSVGIQFNETDLKNQGATSEDYSQRAAATVEIQLEDCAVAAGTRFKVTALVTPENTEQALIWSSSDTGVFEVEPAGIVTVKDAGTAVLTATVGAVTDAVVIEGIQTMADGSRNDLPVYGGSTASSLGHSNQASGGSGTGSGGNGGDLANSDGSPDASGSGGSGNDSGESSSDGSESGGGSSGGDSQNSGSGSSGIGGLLPDMGFSQVLSNVYVCEENGIYYGEIITQPNVTIMYIKRRGETFDARIQSVLSTLLPSAHAQVWNNYLSADTDRTFTAEDRKVRIVVAANGGHSQIVIYN